MIFTFKWFKWGQVRRNGSSAGLFTLYIWFNAFEIRIKSIYKKFTTYRYHILQIHTNILLLTTKRKFNTRVEVKCEMLEIRDKNELHEKIQKKDLESTLNACLNVLIGK